ncbi:MAG: replication protein [Cressdnaviricota sp.]|nr:MAG: replication protein [Cressdnaviricota sp.]
MKYVRKDGDYINIGTMDAEQEKNAKTSKQKILGKHLIEGANLVATVKENPELLMNYNKLKLNLEAFRADNAREEIPECRDSIPNTWGLDMPLKDEKRRHYWIWSDVPDMGKTTWLKSIEDAYKTSWFNQTELYQNIHSDSQFILIDEYSSAKVKATTINQMCDGTYLYPTKGGTAKQVRGTILLVCGNRDPKDVYPEAWPYIEARFTVKKVGDGHYWEDGISQQNPLNDN